MTEIDTNTGNPEVVQTDEQAHVVVDGELAARAFWAGVASAERGLEPEEQLQLFCRTIIETYPTTEKYEQIKKMGKIFLRVSREAKANAKP